MAPPDKRPVFPTAEQDAAAAGAHADSPQARSPSYRLAYADPEFLLREDMRPVRLPLELLKPETVMRERGLAATVVVFGSARIPAPETVGAGGGPEAPPGAACLAAKTRYYEQARAFARLVSQSQRGEDAPFVVVTGGASGIMEAASRGAADMGAQSTPELCFQFHYFAIRKLHFLLRARALAIFPGGFGTLDELFDALTLIQTGKIQRIPIVLFGAEYWRRIIDFEAMAEEGVVDRADVALIDYAETAAEGWRITREFYAEGEAAPEAEGAP